MFSFARFDTITQAINEAREQAATVPLRDYDTDEETVRRPSRESAIAVDTSIFDSLTNFNLDLSLLSSSSSSTPFSSAPPSVTPSPPASPNISRSFSFSSRRGAPTKLTWLAPSHSNVITESSSSVRGSWPLGKYVGRGTPIDHRRRLEWAGVPDDAVGEDGYFFSEAIRSTSLDSAARRTDRPISSDWDHIHHSTNPTVNLTNPLIREPPPALGPLAMERGSVSYSEDWESIMASVLGSSSESVQPMPKSPSSNVLESPQAMGTSGTPPIEIVPPTPPLHFTIMSQDQVRALHSGLDSDLGLNSTLDLGLVQSVTSATHQKSDSISQRRLSSPSVYSNSQPDAQSPTSIEVSDRPTITSTYIEQNLPRESPPSQPWWRRFSLRFRSIPTRLNFQKHGF